MLKLLTPHASWCLKKLGHKLASSYARAMDNRAQLFYWPLWGLYEVQYLVRLCTEKTAYRPFVVELKIPVKPLEIKQVIAVIIVTQRGSFWHIIIVHVSPPTSYSKYSHFTIAWRDCLVLSGVSLLHSYPSNFLHGPVLSLGCVICVSSSEKDEWLWICCEALTVIN